MSRLALKLFLGALVPAALLAQTPTIRINSVRLPVTEIRQGDRLTGTIANVTVSKAANVYLAFRMSINDEAAQDYPVSSALSGTDYVTGTADVKFSYSFQLPKLICVPYEDEKGCPATTRTMGERLRKVTKLQLVASIVDGQKAVASDTRDLDIKQSEIAVMTGASQPMNTKRPLQLRISNIGNIGQYVPDVRLYHSDNAMQCGRPDVAQTDFNCLFSLSTDKFSGPGLLDFTFDSGYPKMNQFVSEEGIPNFLGDYDALATWTESDPRRTVQAFLPKGFRITAPLENDEIKLSKISLRIVGKTQEIPITPGQVNFLDAPAGAEIAATVEGSYKLTRYKYALGVPLLEDAAATESYLQNYVVLKNTSEGSLPLLDYYSESAPRAAMAFLKLPPKLLPQLVFRVALAAPDQQFFPGTPRITKEFLSTSKTIINWGPPPEVGIDHIETVQVVQTKANTIPMVAGKGTVARVFAKVVDDYGKDVSGVKGVLKAYRGEELLGGSATLLNTGAVIASTGEPDREKAERSLNFLLPKEWLSGDVKLRATVWIGSATTPPAETAKNSLDQIVSFQRLENWPATVNIGYLPFCVESIGTSEGGAQPYCPDDGIDSADRLLRKVLPVPDSYTQVPVEYPPTLKIIDVQIAKMLMRAHFYGSMFSSYWFYHLLTGWLPNLLKVVDEKPLYVWSEFAGLNGPGTGGVSFQQETARRTGRAPTPGGGVYPPDVEWISSDIDQYMFAHSTLHSLGQGHTESCTTDEVGFDVEERKVIPIGLRTLMAPMDTTCPAKLVKLATAKASLPSWVSAGEYTRLLKTDAFTSGSYRFAGTKPPTPTRGALRSRSTTAAGTTEVFLVGGTVRRDGTATLDPVLRVATAASPEVNPTGQYCIRIAGAPDSCFDLPLVDADEARPVTERPFIIVVPYAADATKIALLRDGQEIASLTGSTKPPDVTITSPTPGAQLEGEIVLSWTSSAPGGDSQSHSVLYTSDGGKQWLPLAVQIANQQLTIDGTQLTGGDNVQFQVVTSAGLNSGSATVGPISLVQRAKAEPPAGGIAFPNVTLGSAAERGWAVKNAGSGPLTLTVATPTMAGVSVAGSPILTVPAGEQRSVRLRHAPLEAGKLEGAVTVSTSDPDHPSMSVPVSGYAYEESVPSLELAATAVAFGSVAVGQAKDATLTISNAGSNPLAVSAIDFSDRAFTVAAGTLTFAPGEEQAVQVRFSPAAAGERKGTMTIYSNDPTRPKVDVALSGTGIAGGLTLSPATLAFGSVTVGQTKSLNVMVTNKGTAEVVIQSVTADNAKFTASPGSFKVAGGGARDVAVIFHPTAAGAEIGTLTIASSGGTATVALSGTGIAGTTQIAVEPATLEFGSVAVGQSKDLSVTVRNTGTAALTVTSLASSNGRFAVRAPAAPFSVNAGGTQTVTVRFAPTNATVESGTLTVASSGGSATVALSGTGIGGTTQIAVEPATLEFGSVAVRQSKDLSVTVRNSGTAALTVTSAASSNGRFAVTAPATPFTVNAGGTQTVTVRFAPTSMTVESGTLTVASSGGSATVALSGTGTMQITVAPATLDFGSVAVGQTKDLSLTVRNSGTAALTVTSAASSNARFAVTAPATPFTVNAGGTQTVTVQFAPTSMTVESGTLTVTSSGGSATVALSGTGIAGATQIAVTPATLDFGSVAVGQSKDLSVTVRNTGTAALTVTSAASSNARFAVTAPATPFAVNAGGTQTVTVRFAPASITVESGTLTVTSSGGSATVALSGTSAAAGESTATLKVDDGSFETNLGLSGAEAAAFVNRLTPPRYPATLKEVSVYFAAYEKGLKAGDTFALLVGTVPAGAADLSGASFDLYTAKVAGTGAWNLFTVPARTLQSGDLAVGIAVLNAGELYPVAVDTTAPSQRRSWISTDAANWRLLDSFAGMSGNFGIRATVTMPLQ